MASDTNRPLPALGRAFPHLYYGWFVVGGTFGLSLVCVGIGFYLQQVLLDALTALRGFDRVSVSAASSLFFLVSGVVGFAIGPFVDRRGARVSIFAGTVLLAATLIGVSRVREVGWLYLWFPLMAAGFAACTAVPTSAILTRWFIARRSLATMVSQTGVSLGGAVMIPVTTRLIESGGLEWALGVLAAVVVGVALPIVVFVLRFDPGDHGLEPDGSAELAAVHVSLAAQRRVWRRRDAASTPTFWLLAGAFGLVLASQVGMITHQFAALAEHMPREHAMFGGSLIPIGSILGRFAIGFAADRVEKRRLAIGLFCVQAAGILAFSYAGSPATLFAASFLFGLTIGSIFMLQSLITADLFGIPSFGRVYGAVQLCSQLASSTGPLLVGWLYGELGGYALALRCTAGLGLFGAVCLWLVRPPAEEPQGRTL